MSPWRSFPGVVLLLVCGACSSEPTTSEGSGAAASAGGAGNEAGSPAEGGADAAPTAVCEEGTFPGTDTEQVLVGNVTGLVVDELGEPTSAGLVQVCGKDLCINARVTSNGALAEDVGQLMEAPACKVGDGLDWAKLAFPISGGDSELGTLTTARLPALGDGEPLVAGRAIGSGGVTLELAETACIEVDTLTYVSEAEQTFRAVALPDAALSQLGDDFVAGFALAPVETHIWPAPALKLENTAGLPPGSEVTLFMQGLDVLEEFAPYGGFQRLGDGVVSADGSTLEFAEGPPVLTSLLVKVKE
jgi:hypothetical protein